MALHSDSRIIFTCYFFFHDILYVVGGDVSAEDRFYRFKMKVVGPIRTLVGTHYARGASSA